MTDGMIKKEMYRFNMIVSWSDEDKRFIVDIPELPGCRADGGTREEAVKNSAEVIAVWLDAAWEDGHIPRFYSDPDDIPAGYFLEYDPYWHKKQSDFRNTRLKMNMRALIKYSKENGKKIAEMTKEEVMRFSEERQEA